MYAPNKVTLHYFLISDLNLHVKVKINNLVGSTWAIAEQLSSHLVAPPEKSTPAKPKPPPPADYRSPPRPSTIVATTTTPASAGATPKRVSSSTPASSPPTKTRTVQSELYLPITGTRFPNSRARQRHSPIEHELYVSCSIWSNGREIGVPCLTPYRSFPDNSQIKWSEWVTFPVKYRDLSPTSRLVFTVWGISHNKTLTSDVRLQTMAETITDARPLGGTSMPLFNKHGVLKLGHRKLLLWNGVEGDGSVESSTPYKIGKAEGLDKLEKARHKYDQKGWNSVEWLNKLSQRRIEKVLQGNKRGATTIIGSDSGDGAKLYLTVEFPAFKHPVVYYQQSSHPGYPEILPFKEKDRLFVLHDPEMTRENPIENRYVKLARGARGLADRDLKPSAQERKLINEIVDGPNKVIGLEGKKLLWKFRFCLVENKKALVKFLRCVDWNDTKESKQAVDLLQEWSTIDIAHALELLSAVFRNNEGVRTYAVKQLERADNEELISYLLQLVQAIRYEQNYPSVLSDFLIRRCAQSLELANFFYWYVSVEIFDKRLGPTYKKICDDFMTYLSKNKDTETWPEMFANQKALMKNLVKLAQNSTKAGRLVEKRIEAMRKQLSLDGGEMKGLAQLDPAVRLPVKPEIIVNGIVASDSTVFKSALAPMCLCFRTESKENYKTIFKSGDDLRQDQLIIQMINLMDSLLKKVGLDLQLTPYRVLATSPEDGFVEFIPGSYTLQYILKKFNKSIGKFLDHHNAKGADKQRALITFTKSCAGYCVITYLLGIGDRHLENLLLTEQGHLFHIDFGFIFGRDPKPFPPAIKFNWEMIEAMGGADSKNYLDFRKYAVLAFNILRKHASLIINLLSLMCDAGITDLTNENIVKVQDKFRLDLNDEEAESFILRLIDDCSRLVFPQVIDKIHEYASARR